MTPSWLALERYALGELSSAESAAIEAALAQDPDARARLEAIRRDTRAVPPLDLSRPDSGLPLPEGGADDGADDGTVEEEGQVVSLWPRILGGAALLAAAAALVVAMSPGEGGRPGEGVDAGPGFKGGELVMTVEADHGGAVRVGDRVQVRATCAPGERDAVLRADGEVVWEGALACGNRVRLPGAWTLDAPTELCLRVGEEEICEVVGE